MALKKLISREQNELHAEYADAYHRISELNVGKTDIALKLEVYPDETARRWNETNPSPSGNRSMFNRHYSIPLSAIEISGMEEMYAACYTWLKTQSDYSEAVDC